MEFKKYAEQLIQSNPSVQPQYQRLLPVMEQVALFLQEKQVKDRVCVIAIDGRSASGKTTMAGQLGEILGASVIRMDDFFLPLPLRTEKRFEEPGGNVHYERFLEEVLPYVSLPQPFSYRIFDCGKMDYHGECNVESTKFRIVEGAYSCHPLFGSYADITVFSDVEPQEQMRRIHKRNGAAMAEMFRNRWIPLEEKYFQAYQIADKLQVRL